MKILQILLAFCIFSPKVTVADFTPRDIPIRWIELHDSRHPECQDATGAPVRDALPAQTPTAWRSSEWLNWMIARVNKVYTGTSIEFWLFSHDVYCTRTLAKWENDEFTPYPWEQVRADLQLLYPHAKLHDFFGESLSRTRWLEKAALLYGDPHMLTVIMHNDYESGTGGTRIQPDVLPQHGFGPWYTPGVVFMFLSGITDAPNWKFDPELTVAHEIGHALGLCHTLDFEKFCVGPGGTGDAVFPDLSPYTWADHWDQIFVIMPDGEIGAFANRAHAEDWIATNGTLALERIDDQFNITLDATGKATVTLTGTLQNFDSTSTVFAADGAQQIRLLQGLSFDFSYINYTVNRHYTWQRNIMSYRYQETINPYDYLTARFSTSQIEIMQRQLQSSTPFISLIHGVRPVGFSSHFASQYQYLGDGATNDFVWYSNGQGPATVDHWDYMQNTIAFRGAPYHFPPGIEKLVAADLNNDGIIDPLGPIEGGLGLIINWSQPSQDGGTPTWQQEIISSLSGFDRVVAGDFDGNGTSDLLLLSESGSAKIIYLKANSPSQVRSSQSGLAAYTLKEIQRRIEFKGTPVVGNFDGRKGDDLVWTISSGGRTRARMLVANGRRGFKTGRSTRIVGTGEFTPLSGNFNGKGGTDLFWLDNSGLKQVVWWGKKSISKADCGPKLGKKCIWGNVRAASRLELLENLLAEYVTVGDFDGNGADDLFIKWGDAPKILFSSLDQSTSYAEKYTALPVALRSSSSYRAIVGELDNAHDASGKRLGDDIILY